MEKKSNKPFIIRINPELLEKAETAVDKAVLIAMFKFSDNGRGECYASYRKIGEVAGCSDKTAKRAIQRTQIFEKHGKKTVKGGSVQVYKVRSDYAPLLVKTPKVRNSNALKDESAELCPKGDKGKVRNGVPQNVYKRNIKEKDSEKANKERIKKNKSHSLSEKQKNELEFGRNWFTGLEGRRCGSKIS